VVPDGGAGSVMPCFCKHDRSAVNRLEPCPPALLADVLELVPAELEPLPELPHAASATLAPRTHKARSGRMRLRLVGWEM
jgi:hypothetical protein